MIQSQWSNTREWSKSVHDCSELEDGPITMEQAFLYLKNDPVGLERGYAEV